MLLTDEQYVIKWLSQYGALPKTQVVRLLRNKKPERQEAGDSGEDFAEPETRRAYF